MQDVPEQAHVNHECMGAQVSVGGRVVAVKSAGESFGELALLADERRSADVFALKACDFAILRRADYQQADIADRAETPNCAPSD